MIPPPKPPDYICRIKEDQMKQYRQELVNQLATLLSQLREMDATELCDQLKVSATIARIDRILEMSNRRPSQIQYEGQLRIFLDCNP